MSKTQKVTEPRSRTAGGYPLPAPVSVRCQVCGADVILPANQTKTVCLCGRLLWGPAGEKVRTK